jgi:hypothetical protein
MCAIYSRQSQAASVAADDLHVAERHGVDCEYASFAEPPSDLFILPSGDVEPVVSGTADNLRNIACQLGILLAVLW